MTALVLMYENTYIIGVQHYNLLVMRFDVLYIFFVVCSLLHRLKRNKHYIQIVGTNEIKCIAIQKKNPWDM